MFVSVAIDIPVFTLFEYALPAALKKDSLLGRRVRVPLGARELTGIIMEENDSCALPTYKIKKVLEIYEDMPPLPPKTLELIRFCASYYHAPIGVAAAAVIPSIFRRTSMSHLAGGYRLGGDIASVSPKRTAVLQACTWMQDKQCQSAAEIKKAVDISDASIKNMVKEGLLIPDYYVPPPTTTAAAETPPDYTAAQNRALSAIKIEGFSPYLLFGDTGAGKTEIYLNTAQRVMAEGGQALILTPEIHLTPQLEASFARRFPGKRLCVLHSGLTDNERTLRWLAALQGIADVVLGTRLAVFTPLPNLRLIVVDEEHDESYKQEDGLMFSARDVAVWRANNEKVPLICGSATPSLESYENASRGRYTLLRMNTISRRGRVNISLAAEPDSHYNGMSARFMSALGDTLKAGKQALVFINRRGYSPMLSCRQCEWTVFCSACESRMSWHRHLDKIICHRCGSSKPAPAKCQLCSGEMTAKGIGTQRIESALNSRFKPIKTLRLDGDSLSGRDSFDTLRHKISSGDAQLLVGTQIVAKGHNFPNLSFIGILNADASLWSADFRAEERLLMLLRQVIGRGTRNPEGCQALIQTSRPAHPFYRDLLSDNLEKCWERLLHERKRAKLPPFSYCALLRATSEDESRLHDFFNRAVLASNKIHTKGVRIYDPVPAPMAKLANRWRWQLLAQSDNRQALHQFLALWHQKLQSDSETRNSNETRWHIDVDPLQI
ncbi:MAG: replication restart helicase PriA [Gammaproteobacteria bacterium WSBS_2016_MAG_OTU1]